ncbi:DNA polymerase epsilon subunit 4 [Cryptotermes secundus]|uniref:DNA polymerase epsilon subunit 4 n=2 Tax=Cryptotermes secundus TaxID=105785 RepID=A0A2J7RHV4_9NEOP|nr:DNA polymerase epsilon subunit 4 [Cryptotermes secundus]
MEGTEGTDNTDHTDDLAGNNWKDHASGKEVGSAQEETEHEEEKSERILRLPLARVKHIMKIDPDVHFASQEAVFLITKSTELFIESLAKEAYTYTTQGKRRTLQKKDVDNAIESADCLAFLEGVLDT